MKLRVNMTAALAVIALVLALAQFVAPFGPRAFRISPGVLVIIALLLGARYGAQASQEAGGDPEIGPTQAPRIIGRYARSKLDQFRRKRRLLCILKLLNTTVLAARNWSMLSQTMVYAAFGPTIRQIPLEQ